MRSTRIVAAAAVLVLGGGLLPVAAGVPSGTAHGQVLPPDVDPPHYVTYVARQCDEYSDVMANKARNNIMESLRDLGPDSNYAPGDSVDPESEAQGSPNCTPLADWTFSTGTGSASRTPETLDLSTVTGPLRQDLTTVASTPLLDANAQPTGETIEGAVTAQLTADEYAAGVSGSRLWVQGGTPAEPLNGLEEQYAYAALRCSQDALNGDNVEYVSYPQNVRHVFCYYYAVTPPPAAGTVVVEKEIADGVNGGAEFWFDGNISYTDHDGDGVNDFPLTATAGNPASQEFIRGEVSEGDPPWSFQERPPEGWQLAEPPSCVSENGTSTFVIGESDVAVTLAAGDVVTCTFVDERETVGAETLFKETIGGVGTFPFTVDVPDPGDDVDTTVTTEDEGVPVEVAAIEAGAGTYTTTETLPEPTAAGSWELASAECNGEPVEVAASGQDRTATIDVEQGETVQCLMTNEFTPGGSITVDKVTQGGTGAFGYTVTPLAGDTARVAPRPAFAGQATTTAEGEPAQVQWDGPAPEALAVDPPSRYLIQELLPPASAGGRWELADVDCGPNQAEMMPDQAAVIVELTVDDPQARCTFTDRFTSAGTLDVVKHTSADRDLRPEPAVLHVSCDDGTDASVTVAPGDGSGALDAHFVYGQHTCSVAEVATGAAARVTVETNATVRVGDAAPVALTLGEPFTVEPGADVLVTVDNQLTAPEPPEPTEPPGPTAPPPGPPDEPPPGLPSTGAAGWAAMVLGGLSAVALGAALRRLGRRGRTATAA